MLRFLSEEALQIIFDNYRQLLIVKHLNDWWITKLTINKSVE